ncbi:MAG: hypothetical protein P1T08_12005 [Acidimicrobiia bacterium]|nr:hypothetical protein [Acidimicrobiia bacterium]
MRVMVAAATVLVVLAGACASDPDPKVALAVSIGDQLAEPMSASLTDAVGSIDVYERLDDLLVGAILDLALPDGVDELIPGSELQTGRDDEGLAYVATAIAVFRAAESDFCMVVALASDGRVEARPVVAEPVGRCEGAELPDLRLTSGSR